MAFSDTDILKETRKWRQQVIDESTAGAAGAWSLLDTESMSGDPANYEYTWDETAYDEIKIILEEIQPATDGVSMYLIVGHTNGGTMFNSTNDYDNIEQVWESDGAPFAGPDTDKLRVLASCSNAANETISGEITISAFVGTDLGCLIRSRLLYINSSSNMRAYESKGFLDDGGSAAIDTLRLFFASGNLANTGTVRVWGRAVAA